MSRENAGGESLKQVFKECVKALLDFCLKHELFYLVYDLAPKIDIAKRTWFLDIQLKYAWNKPRFFDLYEEIVKLPEVVRCLDVMLEEGFHRGIDAKVVDKDGRPVQNPDYRQLLIYEVLIPFMLSYVKRFGLKFSDDSFEDLYKELIEYIYSPKIAYTVVVPLQNFELTGADEVMIEGLKLRKLKEEEIKVLLGLSGGKMLGTSFLHTGFLENIYCIEKVAEIPKGSSINMTTLINDIEDFITTLRLFKPGKIGFNALLYYPETWKESYVATELFNIPIYTSYPKYILTEPEVNELRKLWSWYKKVRGALPKNVKLSLRWFNKSYTEREEMDRLLDLVIAFEALFQASDRYDLYTARFIGRDKDERKQIYKDMNELRRMRGSIAHTGHADVGRKFVDKIEEYYRHTMRKFVESLATESLAYEDILKEIRESLLS
jgi:hypothetical protein